MNITVENLAPCKKLIRFEVDAAAVGEALTTMTKQFMKEARLPGFRAGKAPLHMVEKQYGKEIEQETRRKIVGESYQKALKDHKLDVLGYPDIEEIKFERDQGFVFQATVETSPDFEMPSYRGMVAKRETTQVTDDDVEKAIESLRGQKADFKPVDRAVQPDDIIVVNYSGTCEGKPITDLAPAAQGLTKKENFWVAVKPDSFIPGFTEQLVGAQKGDHRKVDVSFPADFVTPQLAGKQGAYEVDVVEVRERVLPPVDDTLAKAFGADTLDQLRKGVRQDLQNELNSRVRRSIRGQVVKSLMSQVNFDLPESLVSQETRNVVYDIVHDNQRRGVPKDIIDKNKDDIYNAASHTAKERVKLGFLVQRIADLEGIRATEAEVSARIASLAGSYNMAPKNFLKELQKRNGISEIYQQLVHEKVLDFLQEHAKIEDVPPGQAPA